MTPGAGQAGPYREPATSTAPPRPASEPFARTLADASLGEIVFQSPSTGRVRAPATGARLWIALGSGPVIGVLLILGVGVVPDVLDHYDGDRTAVACIFGGVFIAIGLLVTFISLPLTRAAVLLNTGRLVEADRILSRWSGMRSLYTGNLYAGLLASIRGDQVNALERYRKLMAFEGRIGMPGLAGALQLVGAVDVGPWGRRPAQPQLIGIWLESAFHAARILCNLGRLQDAATVLQVAGPPGGEHHALLRVLAEQYLAFCSGVPTLDDARLGAFTSWASSLRGTWGLLALAGWNYARRGDLATATRLIDEERLRPNAARLAPLMPALWSWMHAGR